MMDADERLTALKKAYADIILNTAKEAAARIMVSERKALRFQHELNNAKQNALQMLLRLKRMMDSKTSEAEMASITQQKKIDELEAQLQEAEDIVKDLREELRAVQAEIERVPPSKEVTHPVQVVDASEENIHSTPPPAVFLTPHVVFLPPEVRPNIVPPSDMGNSDVDQRNKGQSFYNSLLPLKKAYIGKPDLPSIILRSKETELYRNGCTQRIRACGQTPIGKEYSFSEQTNDIKPELIAKEDEGGEKLHKVPLLGADTVCDTEKKNVLQEDSRISSWCQGHDGKRRRRARPCRKKRTSGPSQPLDQVKKMDRAADNSAAASPPSSVKHTNDMTVEKELEKATNTDTDIVRICDVQSTVGEEQVPVRPQISEAQADPSLANMELKSSGSSGVPAQQIKERVIKYTFQRKRKRGTSIADGKACTERSDDLKIKEEENRSAHLESEKVSSIEESTQEKRRLEQVARQLISLSEWQ